MSGGPGTPDLVIAAGRAGSFGFLAGGYKSPEALGREIDAVRSTALGFGVNLFAPNPQFIDCVEYDRYAEEIRSDLEVDGAEWPPVPSENDDGWHDKLDLLLADPPDVVSFTFGIPDRGAIAALRRAGSVTVQTVTSADEAAAADEAGVEALIVQATAAGGHSATLDPRRPIVARPLADITAEIASRTALPLLATGGIGDSPAARAAREAGAGAVLVGTALMLADEAGTNATHRDALVAGERSTVVTRAFTGRPARGLRNHFIAEHDAAAPLGYPAIHYLTSPMRRAAAKAGDPERLHLWAGTGYRNASAGPTAAILERIALSL
jgi:NAD(P)H-dependent flavin oxidoreductase YrpB (nitropropane dioxygenase family)